MQEDNLWQINSTHNNDCYFVNNIYRIIIKILFFSDEKIFEVDISGVVHRITYVQPRPASFWSQVYFSYISKWFNQKMIINQINFKVFDTDMYSNGVSMIFIYILQLSPAPAMIKNSVIFIILFERFHPLTPLQIIKKTIFASASGNDGRAWIKIWMLFSQSFSYSGNKIKADEWWFQIFQFLF